MLVFYFRALIFLNVVVFELNTTPLKPIIHTQDLNSFIKHYEPAIYNPSVFNGATKSRKRRSSTPLEGDIRFVIRGHGRIFRVHLTPDNGIFAPDVLFETTKGPFRLKNDDFAYTGFLEDEENSLVHGVVTSEGLFDGTIETKDEHYYVEPVKRYLPNDIENVSVHHSIIYKSKDVENPGKDVTCASHLLDRKRRWLLSGEGKSAIITKANLTNLMFPMIDNDGDMNIAHPIDEEMTASALTSFDSYRNKRTIVDPKKTTCMLYLQADHHFYEKHGSEEACIEIMTRHVQRVNNIYKNTDFNQDGKFDNITFMIKRIKVHTSDALKDSNYRFAGSYGVEKFLEIFSEEDYDAFCLAYMFTYRDFEMGTLGLAWTGDLKNAGGVCEKNGHYRGSMKSLNTGIVTLLNYGKHVPPAVSHVTLAHEIGHNFGSPHDPDICTPGGEDGNYIMFARATSGDKRNNNKFSPCSIRSINPVLNFKARSSKGCFGEPQTSLCGNGVVEDGEECDCGWEEDCHDKCCYPQRRRPPADEKPCTLTPRSHCSPSQGPCCTSDCRVKFGDKCRDDNGCRDASFCNGRSAHCPPSINKPNKTICNDEYVCFMGECTGSICLAYGLESCQCIPLANEPSSKACELCCKMPGENEPCKSSFEWNLAPYDVPDMYSKPGTPCNNYNGYCDIFQKCRDVDPSGPLATLRKLLLSDETIANFKKWLFEYWYAPVLLLFLLVSLTVIGSRRWSKKSKGKLKKVTVMHSSKGKVEIPKNGEAVTVHPAVKSKLPLRRKVNKVHNNNNNNNNKKSRQKRRRRNEKKEEDNSNNNNNKKVKVENGNDTVNTKVQSWLMKSQFVLPKSKSTPADLAATKAPTSSSPNKKKTQSSGNINNGRNPNDLIIASNVNNKEKVRVQVLYKPPFKFSVKLRKPDKNNVERDVRRKVVVKCRTGLLVKQQPRNNRKSCAKSKVIAAKKVDKSMINNINVNNSPPVVVTSSLPNNDNNGKNNNNNIDSNVHTVQSDLEVLLSEE